MRTSPLLPIAIIVSAMSASVAITAIRHAKAPHATARARVTVVDYTSRTIEGDARTFKYDGRTFTLDVVPANSGVFKNGFDR